MQMLLIRIHRPISMEDVVEQNPDVIFLIVSDGEYSQADTIMNYVLQQPALQGVNALRNKRVYFLAIAGCI